MVEMLKQKQGSQSLRRYAKAIGCSAPYLSDVYLGKRDPGPKLLNHLELEREKTVTVTYTYRKRRWK